MKGHFTPNPLWTNEVWGLDVMKTQENRDKFVSCSDDATVRIYSSRKRKVLCIMRTDVDKNGKPIKRTRIKGFPGKGMPTRATARSVAVNY